MTPEECRESLPNYVIACQIESLKTEFGIENKTLEYIVDCLRKNHRDWACEAAFSESDKLWFEGGAKAIRKFIHQFLAPIGYWDETTKTMVRE